MNLISVNIGKEQTIAYAKKSGDTGIYKHPVLTPVQVTPDGLLGDAIVDTKNHGGVDQAIYVYSQVDYHWWEETLGKAMLPGTFGENLTITDLESATMDIGDRLLVRSVILEVTCVRIPCTTLAARMGDPIFIKRFREAERPGFYCRVIRPGWIQVGDPYGLERTRAETVSILEMYRDYYEPRLQEAVLRRYLAAPIAIRARKQKEKQLQNLLHG